MPDKKPDDFVVTELFPHGAEAELALLRAEGQLYKVERDELLAVLREDWRKKETMFHLGGVVSLEVTPLSVPKDSRVGMMLCRKVGNVFLGDIVNEPGFGWTWFYQGVAYSLEFKELPLREHLRFLTEFGIEEGLKVTVEEDRTLRLSYPATAEEMISAWLI